MTPEIRARLALLALPKMGPARLSWLLADGNAEEVIGTLRSGRLPIDIGEPPPGVSRETVSEWQRSIRSMVNDRVEEIVAATEALGASILSPLGSHWPLAEDPEPPVLLFAIGNLELLDAVSRVAVVGTRRCTALGRTVAHQMGSDLATAGSAVVSGLALGVDGAAHRGCLDGDGGAIGVVGSGLDVVYPRANRALWDEVAERGLLLTEAPTTFKPQRWRFPARNRLIAALSHGIVVVESHQRGGALSTADEGLQRDRPVMAVPGSVLSPASRGTNALLVDGAVPVRDAVDVLAALGHPIPGSLVGSGTRPEAESGRRSGGGGRSGIVVELRPGSDRSADIGSPWPLEWPAESVGGRILAEVATGPTHLDRLVLAVGLSVADVLATVQELQAAGLVELDGSTVVPIGPRP